MMTSMSSICSRRAAYCLVLGSCLLAATAFFRLNLQHNFHDYPSPSYIKNTDSEYDSDRLPESTAVLQSLSSASAAVETQVAHASQPGYCKAFQNARDVQVVVKTGATELLEKMPIQVMTALHCIEDLLIFSDMEQQVGRYHIYDALAQIPDSLKDGNTDFNLYRMQKDYTEKNQDLSLLRTLTAPGDDEKNAGWTLDKYKFLNMVVEAYHIRPDKKWYIFLEADTYLFWSNLLLWSNTRLDSSKPLYLGAPAVIQGHAFAHGGSGFMFSNPAMHEFIGANSHELTEKWDNTIHDECCGDYWLARFLEDRGINVSGVFPMINGERTYSLPFGPELWCQPVITLHHMSPTEVHNMWSFEQQRADPATPITYEELFTYHIKPHLVSERDDWDNLSEDFTYTRPDLASKEEDDEWQRQSATEQNAHTSFENCAKACEAKSDCLQYVFSSEESCSLSTRIRLGTPRLPGHEGKSYKSGYDLARIAEFVGGHSPCERIDWVG